MFWVFNDSLVSCLSLVYAQQNTVCKQEHQHACKRNLPMYIFSKNGQYVMWHRPFSTVQFGANVEMFTQIIAQGHFKWTRIDNKNVHLNFWLPAFTSAGLLTHSVSQFETVRLQRRAVSFEPFKCTMCCECLWDKGWNVECVYETLSVDPINFTFVTFLLTKW